MALPDQSNRENNSTAQTPPQFRRQSLSRRTKPNSNVQGKDLIASLPQQAYDPTHLTPTHISRVWTQWTNQVLVEALAQRASGVGEEPPPDTSLAPTLKKGTCGREQCVGCRQRDYNYTRPRSMLPIAT